jgi:hypothetical protein
MPFHVKKGAADPFRGDWYIAESVHETSAEAIANALKLTQQNLNELWASWDQYGYEWSVFEETASGEKKIWEGFKAVSIAREKHKPALAMSDGFMTE